MLALLLEPAFVQAAGSPREINQRRQRGGNRKQDGDRRSDRVIRKRPDVALHDIEKSQVRKANARGQHQSDGRVDALKFGA